VEYTRTEVVVPTADEALRAANAVGITGEAARLVVKAGAQRRHESRVHAALNIALAWARHRLYDVPMPGQVGAKAPNLLDALEADPDEVAVAWAVLKADGFGVGKPASWARSQREAPLDACGKGRRAATDGDAWTAAIADASIRMGEVLGGPQYAPEGTTIFAGGVDVGDILSPATIQAIAGRCMLSGYASVQADSSHAARAAAWADVYNAACERERPDESLNPPDAIPGEEVPDIIIEA